MDMTGLAQKGGAVWSHIKIYEKGIKPFSQKISPGSADLLLACDAVVGTKPEIQEVVSDEKTTTVINNNTIPVSDFVTDRELDFKDNEVLEMITKTTKKVASSVPAIKISEVLSGDAIGTNMVMLGSAYQNGLIPLKAENIVNAIKLNGVGIERNIYNFNLGRLYVIDPENELFDFLSKDKIRELGFEELYEDRLSRIEKYDQRVVKDFQKTKEGIDSLLSTEVDSERLNIDAIKELYRVFAIKDEYEVARMHLETTSSVLDGQFKDWKNLSFYLSPPMLSFIKDKRTGRPRKIKVPGYIAIPMFKLLRSLSFLRGTIFDPLNLTSDRRRDLKHKRIFKQKIADINKLNSGEKAKKLRDLITASSNVKGYGPVRHEAFIKFKDQSNQIK